MADNTEIKDGLGNEFTLRSRDVSQGQDNSIRRSMVYMTPFPIDSLGAYQVAVRSGTMAAGLAANSPIISFRFTSTGNILALVKRVSLSSWSLGTGFAAGIASFDLFFARIFTLDDTGGLIAPIAGHVGKLRTSKISALGDLRYSDTATLTAGTRQLDATAMATFSLGVPTSTNTTLFQRMHLLDKQSMDHPVTLATNEGLIVQATVPATGTWGYAVAIEWDEVQNF